MFHGGAQNRLRFSYIFNKTMILFSSDFYCRLQSTQY